MKFKVTNSPIKPMNGDYEVGGLGWVKNLTEDRLCKPGIRHIIRWMCEDGNPGLIWVGKDCWILHENNLHSIMNALGY